MLAWLDGKKIIILQVLTVLLNILQQIDVTTFSPTVVTVLTTVVAVITIIVRLFSVTPGPLAQTRIGMRLNGRSVAP